MPDGWTCPGCGRCFAPTVDQCWWCPEKPMKQHVLSDTDEPRCRKALEWLVAVALQEGSSDWFDHLREACRMAGIPWTGEEKSDEAR